MDHKFDRFGITRAAATPDEHAHFEGRCVCGRILTGWTREEVDDAMVAHGGAARQAAAAPEEHAHDTATPFYLRQAAAKLIAAAVELEAQAGYHRERALGQIGLAESDIALCRRRIGRSLDASAETLRLQSERRQTRAAKL